MLTSLADPANTDLAMPTQILSAQKLLKLGHTCARRTLPCYNEVTMENSESTRCAYCSVLATDYNGVG